MAILEKTGYKLPVLKIENSIIDMLHEKHSMVECSTILPNDSEDYEFCYGHDELTNVMIENKKVSDFKIYFACLKEDDMFKIREDLIVKMLDFILIKSFETETLKGTIEFDIGEVSEFLGRDISGNLKSMVLNVFEIIANIKVEYLYDNIKFSGGIINFLKLTFSSYEVELNKEFIEISEKHEIKFINIPSEIYKMNESKENEFLDLRSLYLEKEEHYNSNNFDIDLMN